MPTKASRARRWLKQGLAVVYPNDLKVFAVELVNQPSGEQIQDVAIGIDPGKMFSGVAVQSDKATLWTGHLVLPYKKVRERMDTRRMMRRNRRSRQINRKVPYSQRSHRQKRFSNRVAKKVPPSIRANRQLEQRVAKELSLLYPVKAIVYEVVKARGNNGFSPVMVGQYWSISQLKEIAPVTQRQGWETALKREALGLVKDKTDKSRQTVNTHAVDGIALAATHFFRRRNYYHSKGKLSIPENCNVTNALFFVIRRAPISRRQLHLLQFSLGGKRRKYGGTTTSHGFRKGDYVEAVKAGKTYRGWVSGETARQVSVSDINWKRIGQFTARKVRLLKRSTGLIVNN
ncbi:RRXRR domain-containing protein [Moorena producens JHB]|uniref:RRXRR domain-containing protein n=1 Tax=Moorena producens (strain JHB) TaxID=1454205 RepID=A0A1D9G4B4_MOOP1|nr:RRXRR domain-containing protein [Moorena producens]AOY82489.2 RRXRR domain-containing protein [Moorena producens JHB]